MTIGEKIQARRQQLGLTRRQLGMMSGIDTSAIWNIEQGYTRRPRDSTVAKIAQALGVDVLEYELEKNPTIRRRREFEARYRECREKTGRSLERAARELGIHADSLVLFESGKRRPTVLEVIHMSQLYGVTLGYLVGVGDEVYTGPRCALGAPCSAGKRIDYCCTECPERAACSAKCENCPDKCGQLKGGYSNG